MTAKTKKQTLHQQQKDSYNIETTASKPQLDAREKLSELYKNSPLPQDDILFNIGLYTRSSVLVKFLIMSQIYDRIKHLPGVFIEFGIWWGQNMVMLENLRSIHEPFNKQRTIIGFDTFEGYPKFSERDKASDVWNEHSYATSSGYENYLEQLLTAHEGSNVLGHLTGRHKLIKGNVEVTAPEYFKQHPETLVAFAYFDMALYKPTKAALEAIKPHLLSGSILLMDELTWPESPGEALAFKEVFTRDEVLIEKCALYPSKAIVTIR